jgi:hypothetical protein
METLTKAEFYMLLDEFIERLEQERNAETEARHGILHRNAIAAGRRGYTHVSYDEGQRFVRVTTESGQTSVAYFVEKDTGIIFGASSFKKYNPARQFGTLKTVDDYIWGGYYGIPKGGSYKDTLVPKALRR